MGPPSINWPLLNRNAFGPKPLEQSIPIRFVQVYTEVVEVGVPFQLQLTL